MRPPHAYLPPAVVRGRVWGFGLNLYALRSTRNWGIGDFTDLARFVGYATDIGADAVGVNPLHALHHANPAAASPYSPTSRYFLNPLYIDIEAVNEYADPAAQGLRNRVASNAFTAVLQSLREAPNVDYVRVARAKYSALQELYGVFRERRGARAEAFRAFVAQSGERLERFAIHEALTERFAPQPGRNAGWTAWPPKYADPGSAETHAFARSARRRIEYFQYLQWLADEQLAAVAAQAREMALGLYLDVAVGVDLNSADVWSQRDAYVLDETIGAPPDALGPQGQNWGLAAPDARGMLDAQGATFRELLARNMAHAGVLRLDHVMALARLFRIPRGRKAVEGSYVSYPLEPLLSIAATESTRARCLVVGEDLGTVPDGFRERLAQEAIFSYRLLLFEREKNGAFKAPDAYPNWALATCTTHDLPTLRGYALGRDIDARAGIGEFDGPAAAAYHRGRREDVSQLLHALLENGALDKDACDAIHRAVDERDPDPAAFDGLIAAAYRFLAASPARFVLVQLDDATRELDQVNLPGTSLEYPNWRRKNALDLDQIMGDARIAGLAREICNRVKGVAAQ